MTFLDFLKQLPNVSLEMVMTSPPMILHVNDRKINRNWLQDPVQSPSHWIRPIILKNYHGMPLVQGIAEAHGQ